MAGVPNFAHSQYLKLPYPTTKFTGQTIIVTGSNTGIGLEAARHFVRLDAGKVILAVRSLERGNAAKLNIETSENRPGVVEVWELDLSSYASVLAFTNKAQELQKLDIAILNAGISTLNFELVEGDEKNVTINVIGTFLLALGLLPSLRETAKREGKVGKLAFTGSFVHFLTEFPERKNERIFEALRDEKSARMEDRYNVTKMIQLLCMRELAAQLTSSEKEGKIITSLINPGFVVTEIMRERGFWYKIWFLPMKWILARMPEMGGRTLVHAAEGGGETHGMYLSDCVVATPSEFVTSEEGLEAQKRLWKELGDRLENVQRGIMQNI